MLRKHPKTLFSPSRIVAGLALASASATMVPAALAQDGAMLEEVIVSARKVDESMQNVPIAVSAFSGSQIDDLVMRDIREMEGLIPNLVIDAVSVAPAGASVYIRGVGTQEVERSFDAAVGVVIDGVPLSFVNGSMANTFDFESFEVLRGPQGTLFGRNTTGGVINITRSRPTGEFGLKYELTAGENARQDVKGVLNFPIIKDQLAGKIGFAQQKDGGARKHAVTGERIGDADNKDLNLTLLWTPSEDVEALFTYTSYTDENDGIGLQNITSLSSPMPELPCFLGECGDAVTDISSFTQDYLPPVDFEWDSYTLNLNWDVGIGTITSITGHQETDEAVGTDFDATGINFFHALRLQESEQTSTELRFASSEELSENIDFVVGLFWLEDEYQLEQRTSIAAFGGPAAAIFQNPFADHEREVAAIFGEIHWNFGDFTLTYGYRYTEEEKSYTGTQNLGGGSADLGPLAMGYLAEGVDDLYVFGTPIFTTTGGASGSETWEEDTHKVGIDYQINDEVLVYASFAQGFRSGGFNGRNQDPANIGPFDPEFVENWEVGMKADFFSNTLRVNLAAFYTDYDDKQEEVIQPDGFGGSNTVVANASTVESQGVEAEVTWVVNESLRFNANLGYLDASYDAYLADLTGDGVITDNSNLELRRVPEWTGGANGVYSIQIGPGELSAFVGYRYTDEYWVEVSNDPRGLLSSRGVWDANLAYEWDWDTDRSVRLTLFGRDLTDEEDYSSAVTIPGTIAFAGVTGGREYGVQISGNF